MLTKIQIPTSKWFFSSREGGMLLNKNFNGWKSTFYRSWSRSRWKNYLEPVKNGPAPQHWTQRNSTKSGCSSQLSRFLISLFTSFKFALQINLPDTVPLNRLRLAPIHSRYQYRYLKKVVTSEKKRIILLKYLFLVKYMKALLWIWINLNRIRILLTSKTSPRAVKNGQAPVTI